ncbi:MAG: hypothetical protein CL845_06030 [Crocinitomicaceae bacterium]|nr:hypothetical protein [Crocinitomicaceae bacterium]
MLHRTQFRNQFLGLLLLAIATVAVSCGQYFRATEHYSGQIEEALERVVSPAFYNVFVTPQGQDIFQLNYFFYDREKGTVVGIYKAIDPDAAERYYRYAPKMNRYTLEDNGSIDGPGGLVYEIRIQANEVIYEGDGPRDGARVEIPIENIYQLDLLEHNEAAGIFRKIGGGVAALGAAAWTFLAFFLSCPFIYIQDGETERFMGEVFSGSVTENMARHDFLPLPGFEPADGLYELRIANEMEERQYTDFAVLEAVEHPEGMEVLMTPEGVPVLFAAPLLPSEAVTDHGTNCQAIMAVRDGIAYDFTDECAEKENFSSLSIAFDNPAGADKAHVILHVKNTMWSMIMYESFMSMFGGRYDDYVKHQRDRSAEQKTQWLKDQGQMLEVQLRRAGQWETVHWVNLPGPYAFRSEAVPLDLSNTDEGSVELRLVAGYHFWELDYAVIDYTDQPDMVKTPLALLSAEDEQGQDVASHLLEVDGDYLERLFIGADATLKFQALPAPEFGNVQSVFMHAYGYYEPIREYAGIPNMTELKKFKEPGHFARFSKERFNDIAGITP